MNATVTWRFMIFFITLFNERHLKINITHDLMPYYIVIPDEVVAIIVIVSILGKECILNFRPVFLQTRVLSCI